MPVHPDWGCPAPSGPASGASGKEVSVPPPHSPGRAATPRTADAVTMPTAGHSEGVGHEAPPSARDCCFPKVTEPPRSGTWVPRCKSPTQTPPRIVAGKRFIIHGAGLPASELGENEAESSSLAPCTQHACCEDDLYAKYMVSRKTWENTLYS